jgi:hypothetical protein
MSDTWPWEPRGQRPAGPSGEPRGPDPEPIVRVVRIGFVFAGLLAAAMVNAGLRLPAATRPGAAAGHDLLVTGAVGALVLVLLVLAWRSLRPARLLSAGKRALDPPDARQRRPRVERARQIGFRGLALGWATPAMLVGFVPVLVGLALESLHGRAWELLAFAAVSLLAGFGFQLRVSDAVRLAVDDPVLRASYGG